MKVIVTIQSLMSDAPPVEMVWLKNGTAMDVVGNIVSLLNMEDEHTSILAITIEL